MEPEEKSLFRIPFGVPSYERPPAYVFVEPQPTEIYKELIAISEEIEQCRKTRLQNY